MEVKPPGMFSNSTLNGVDVLMQCVNLIPLVVEEMTESFHTIFDLVMTFDPH